MKHEPRYYYFSEIKIEVNGRCKVANLLHDEFRFCSINKNQEEVDLKINIYDGDKSPDFNPIHYSLSGNVAFDKTDYLKKEKEYKYIVKNLFEKNKLTELNIYYNETQSFKDIIKNILKSFVGASGFVDKYINIANDIMSYNLFWYIFPMILLKKDKAFIHSSSLELNNKGVVFCGTGGCGKTSTTFKLLESRNTKYLAEDFSIVSSEGKVFFNPKKMSIYKSDVQFGAKDLTNYVKCKMKKADKLFWNLNGIIKKNSRRKVSPNTLLSIERISKSTKISKAYFFCRSNANNIHVKDISTDELVERVSNASFRELKMLYEILMNVKAVGHDDVDFPNFVEVQAAVNEIYRKAFENVDKSVIRVPLKSSPDNILSEIGLISGNG